MAINNIINSLIVFILVTLILNVDNVLGAKRYWANYPGAGGGLWTCGRLPDQLPTFADANKPGVYLFFQDVPVSVLNPGGVTPVPFPLSYVGHSASSVYSEIYDRWFLDDFCTDSTKPGKLSSCGWCYYIPPTATNGNPNPDMILLKYLFLSTFCATAQPLYDGGIQGEATCILMPGPTGQQIPVNLLLYPFITNMNLEGPVSFAFLTGLTAAGPPAAAGVLNAASASPVPSELFYTKFIYFCVCCINYIIYYFHLNSNYNKQRRRTSKEKMIKSKASYEVFHYTVQKDNLDKGLKDIARHFVSEYHDSTDDQLTITRLNGGITNILYLVEDKSIEPKAKDLPVVIRLYGYKSEDIIDRKNELVVQTEADFNGLGAKFYGLFDNGCIYGFIPGRPLEHPDLSEEKNQVLIASEIAEWHQAEMPTRKQPSVWNTIKKWAALAPQTYPDEKRQAMYASLRVDEMKEEYKRLEQQLATLQSPIVFCHNDLLSRNIIVNKEGDRSPFIDFEYANYNFRGFELGNHFNEYAGFEPDYKLYPTRDQQLVFITQYLRVISAGSISNFQSGGGVEPTQDQIERLYIEANQYSLASNIFWGFWSIVQSMNSEIDFDYLEYGKARFDRYWTTKEQFLSLSK
ncbi:ethanolamine kinase A [Cavenderia fasciculata]|uniref:ethanolamine kinase n=1 Tax=Cavenderia fasciculata TaxID=261658 RepID=F4PIA4_CACFS|nr:ethanolamine kinase A [Cavenderia fasciculata]EGG24538.1 ethanolamine kinase A [Cavenderia fasciculata]|eukprot:XP_004362389.1 ethanolamine kinase A [Cavenderia fasciculata]